MPVTIKQIAELANVSRGTVDKVLNQRPGVKEATREKVLKIAQELNYQPNFLGKALVQSKNPTKLGIVLTPEHNPYIQKILMGIKKAEDEFRTFGISVSVKMPISLEPAAQIGILSELEAEGVNGIALFPIEDASVREKINQLASENIAILTCNSKMDQINDFCFIGQDHYKGGRVAAGLMRRLISSDGFIGLIISSHYLSCHPDRLRGFSDRLKESGANFQILEVQENQDQKPEAFKITLEYLNRYPQMNGIYITGGGVEGVVNALKLLERSNDIRVICHDLTPDSIALLKSGDVDFVIDQDPEYQGYQTVKVLFDYIVKKQAPEKHFVEIPILIMTEDVI